MDYQYMNIFQCRMRLNSTVPLIHMLTAQRPTQIQEKSWILNNSLSGSLSENSILVKNHWEIAEECKAKLFSPNPNRLSVLIPTREASSPPLLGSPKTFTPISFFVAGSGFQTALVILWHAKGKVLHYSTYWKSALHNDLYLVPHILFNHPIYICCYMQTTFPLIFNGFCSCAWRSYRHIRGQKEKRIARTRSTPFLYFLHVLSTGMYCKRTIQHSTLTDHNFCSKSIKPAGIRV